MFLILRKLNLGSIQAQPGSFFRVYGHNGGAASGVTWADNFYMDFTLKSESVTQPVKKPFEAKIVSVVNTNQVQVDKSYNDISFALGIEDTDLDTDISVVDGNISGYETIPPIAYESFQSGKTIREIMKQKQIIDDQLLDELLNPKNMIKPK